jgi:hypothetical protein
MHNNWNRNKERIENRLQKFVEKTSTLHNTRNEHSAENRSDAAVR